MNFLLLFFEFTFCIPFFAVALVHSSVNVCVYIFALTEKYGNKFIIDLYVKSSFSLANIHLCTYNCSKYPFSQLKYICTDENTQSMMWIYNQWWEYTYTMMRIPTRCWNYTFHMTKVREKLNSINTNGCSFIDLILCSLFNEIFICYPADMVHLHCIR